MSSTKEKRIAIFTDCIRTKGIITIPKEIRDAYKIEEGNLVECTIKILR
jgi:AbrB family looped-hinge helix DNA binding protein